MDAETTDAGTGNSSQIFPVDNVFLQLRVHCNQAANQLAGLVSQYQSTPKFDPENKDLLLVADAVGRCMNAVNCRAEMAEQVT